MPRRNLTDSLRVLVTRHGISAVLHSLADIEENAATAAPCSDRKTQDPGKSRPSAVACVGRMTISPNKIVVMRRAAELFEHKRFLPALSDVREFSRVHGLDLPKSASRASSIHRVFAFMASMDTDAIEKILDEGAFSGPTRLAPIADAIRGHSAARRHDRVPLDDRPKGGPVPKPEHESAALVPGPALQQPEHAD